MIVERNIGRKGMWTQVFLILFFVLLVILAIVLLTIDRSGDQTERPGMNDQMNRQVVNAMLINTLRTPTAFKIDGNPATAPLADIVIMNFDQQYNNDIAAAIAASMPEDRESTAQVQYSAGCLAISVVKEDSKKLHSGEAPGVFTKIRNFFLPASGDILNAEADLPGAKGNIKVKLALSTTTFTGKAKMLSDYYPGRACT